MKKVFKWLVLGMASVMMLSSCFPKFPEREKQDGEFFDFATTELSMVDVNYRLSGKNPILMSVYGEDPLNYNEDGTVILGLKEGLTPYFRGITDSKGVISGKVLLPKYLEEVYLYSDYIGVPRVIKVTREDGYIYYDAKNITKTKAATKVSTKAGSVPDGWLTLGDWNSNGLPDYLMSTPATLPDYLLEDVMQTLPDANGNPYFPYPNQAWRNEWLTKDNILNTIKLKNSRELELVFVHFGGSWSVNNVIAYYHYPTNTPPANIDDVPKIIAFPNAKAAGTGGPLVVGDRIKLKYWDGTAFQDEFPAGTTVGLILSSNGFSGGNVAINNPQKDNLFFSDTYLNYPGTAEADKKMNQIAMWDRTRKCVVFGIEDLPMSSPWFDQDLNDVIVYIPIEEKDFDTDDMPEIIPDPEEGPDPTENYVEYVGTLAFEDLWPYSGDYDMNDLVIEYKSTHYKNEDNETIKIVDIWTPKWTGAVLNNAFAYQINVPIEKIRNVIVETNYEKSVELFNLDARGLEVGQTLPVIILYDDMNRLMGGESNDGSWEGRNQNKGKYSFKVTIDITEPVGDDYVTKSFLPPYNPFIVVDVDNENYPLTSARIEVHLPNYPPTDFVKIASFGTGDDRSVIANNWYYLSGADYPFAIQIPDGSYYVPQERQEIDLVYPKFKSWAQSFGLLDQDWYKYPAE